jgi:hypothetical protein
MAEYITKKEKPDSEEVESKYITKKKKKINLDEVVSKAFGEEEEDTPKTTKYITKKKKNYITKKSPEEIREREMTKAKGGRVQLRGGGICKRGINKKAIGANS